MKTLAILAQKGGAGKTTVSVHLAAAAAAAGRRVAIFDADPQKSASNWRARRDDEIAAGADLAPIAVHAGTPDARQLAAAGVELAIIDGAPRLDGIAPALARLADLILVPVRCSILDLDAVAATVRIIQAAGRPAVFVLNAAPTNTARPAAETRAALEPLGVPLCPVELGHRIAYSDALNGGAAVTEFDPKSKAAAEVAALYQWMIGELR